MPSPPSPNPRRSSSAPSPRRAAPPPASTITAGELALVGARYDIGEITRVQRLKRGSGSSPKVIFETSTGLYLLKRLAPSRADPRRVAFGHELQLFLLSKGFPAPRLIGTRAGTSRAGSGAGSGGAGNGGTGGNNSMLQVRGHTYELYRYIHGREDSRSPADARDAGRTLALLHRTLESFRPTSAWVPNVGTYHDSPLVPTALERIPKRFDDPDRREVTLALTEQYRSAAARARTLDATWTPGPIIHGDWHPGNMLFALTPPPPSKRSKPDSAANTGVVCVLDFDSARPGPRVIDVANGGLQFAMARRITPASDLSESKLHLTELDLDRFRAFIDGYHFGLGRALSPAERDAVPWLMIQALIAEAALPIAITGRFGKVDPMGLLRVVRQKTRWIADHAEMFRIGG